MGKYRKLLYELRKGNSSKFGIYPLMFENLSAVRRLKRIIYREASALVSVKEVLC